MTPTKAISEKCKDCQPVRAERDNDFCLESGGCHLAGVKAKRMQAIRKYCLWCMQGSAPEVAACTSPACSLYQYRFGKNPNSGKKGNPEALRKARQDRQVAQI